MISFQDGRLLPHDPLPPNPRYPGMRSPEYGPHTPHDPLPPNPNDPNDSDNFTFNGPPSAWNPKLLWPSIRPPKEPGKMHGFGSNVHIRYNGFNPQFLVPQRKR